MMIQSTMWNELDTMRREMDNLFNGLTARSANTSPRASLLDSSRRQYPALRMHQDTDAVYVEAALPGVDLESLDMTVKSNVLTLSGEKGRCFGDTDGDTGTAVVHRRERAAGKFARRLQLPAEIDADQVSAAYTDGMLVVTLPKADAAKPKQIRITVA